MWKNSFYKNQPCLKKETFKGPTLGLKENVFNFGKQINYADFVKNCEAIYKFVSMKYKNGELKIPLAINNMEKPNITVPGVP